MIVYIMRHGTTVWNEKGITQGRNQNRLSLRGKQEVYLKAQQFKNTPIDVIICSPVFRAVQTANIMNVSNKKVIKNNLLTEIDQGIFAGRHKDSFTLEEQKLRAQRSKACGMENFEELKLRCKKFLQQLKTQNYNAVLVVTHNATASILADLICGNDKDYKNIRGWNFNNAEIKKFVI